MRNWAGQDIKPGDTVWRGARAGNTSDFKVGTVLSINEEKGTARVQWKFEQGWTFLVEEYVPKHFWENLPVVQRITSKGSPSIDSLCLVDIDLEYLGECAEKWQELREEAIRRRDS